MLSPSVIGTRHVGDERPELRTRPRSRTYGQVACWATYATRHGVTVGIS
jgi:hypothetical protein